LARDFRGTVHNGDRQQMLDWIQFVKLSGIGSLVRLHSVSKETGSGLRL